MKMACLTSFPAALALSLLMSLPIYSSAQNAEQFSNWQGIIRQPTDGAIFDSQLFGIYPTVDGKEANPLYPSTHSDNGVSKPNPVHENDHSSSEEIVIHPIPVNPNPIHGNGGDGIQKYFTISGFTLPVTMAYSNEASVPVRVPGISTSADSARAFVERIITQAAYDVYEAHGSDVGLINTLTSFTSPNELSVHVPYDPLECNVVLNGPAATGSDCAHGTGNHCFVVGKTVTSLCSADHCAPNATNGLHPTPIPARYLTISGYLKTDNVVMTNWPTNSWQTFMNRVLRRLSSGPFGANFFTATANIA
ncbi:hypothetical protein KIN20_035119 [Parelaphostrongylus tenuis]|uniref:Uncharacterized protein n=1 Tax=Parelaphostrongylus tenuis TaxID=148309 RepID=A0AAD5RBB2_PARTN|nr:hypothetical protein KIN20_035119 [Parelaphostrongylus tenuis]KAJ1372836.1 hypothetical protein KIN20_035119 [Parelaphostrongylus tenuis]